MGANRDVAQAGRQLLQARALAAEEDTYGTAHDTSMAARRVAVDSSRRAASIADKSVLKTSNMERYTDRFLGLPLPFLVRQLDTASTTTSSTLRGPA